MGKFKGCGVAMVTPFKEKEVDWYALSLLVETLIRGKVDFLVPCGTTGESPTLSHRENEEVIREVVQLTEGRVPVLAGTGSNSTDEAVEMTRAAEDAGADGAMLVVPYYNKPTQRGIILHFEEIAKTTNLPLIMYDIPGRTSVQVESETITYLAKENVIQGLKWASGDIDQLKEVVDECPNIFDVLSGNDNQTLDCMTHGGDGVISVIANIIPSTFSNFVSLLSKGKIDEAGKVHKDLSSAMNAMFLETNPIPIKTALSFKYPDILAQEFRLPLCTMEGYNRNRLIKLLQDEKIID